LEEQIARLVEALRRIDPDSGIDEAADWIWLSGFLREKPDDKTPAPRHQDKGAEPTYTPPSTEPPPTPPGLSPPDRELGGARGEHKTRRPGPGLVDLTTARTAQIRHTRGGAIPFGTPGGHGLPGALEIARALRPLIRRVPSPDLPQRLDEEGTIRRVIDSDLWVPLLRSQTKPWLDLALVVDESPSMRIWHETVRELRLLLSQIGAFWDLRTWSLRTHSRDQDVTLHRQRSKAQRHHKELLSPARNHLILIISDCASPSWRGETLISWLDDWCRHHPVGLLQVLPDQRLWSRGPLGRASRLAVSASDGATPNVRLRARPLSLDKPGRRSTEAPMPPLPMTTLAPRDLRTWAELVAGKGQDELIAFVLRPGSSPRMVPRLDQDWQTRYAAFRENASPIARRLACVLAAAPLRLPVIRLVQDVMKERDPLLRQADQTHLAEFFLSGLIKRSAPMLANSDGLHPGEAEAPELIDYDFLTPELRRRLLSDGLVNDAIEIQVQVGEYVSRHLGGPNPFLAALKAGKMMAGPAIDAGSEPFAYVANEVLGWLGVPYEQLSIESASEPVEAQMPLAEQELEQKVQDVPTPETSTSPVQLWPDKGLDSLGAGTTYCYARLFEICNRGEVPGTEERRGLWQAVKKDRPSSFLAWQLATVARWSMPEYLEVDEHFTPLQVQVWVPEHEEGPVEKQQLPVDTLAEAMTAVFEEQLASASVIFAPPGGGKSTLLRHYQLQQARRLGEDERLVFYVQLRDYQPEKLPKEDRDTGLPALAWLESEWRGETARAPPLVDFMRQGSLTLLLDGLSEIPHDSEKEYRARVGEWRDLVSEVDGSYPGVRLLFACRPLDYTERLDQGRLTRLPAIEVQAMEPARIKTFIDKRFDPRSVTQVWAQLQDHPALALYSSPYALNLLLGQIDTVAPEIEIPQDRAALFSGMVRARLRRECQKGSARFADPKLLSEGDRTVLMSSSSGAHWLPKDTLLFEALAALAFHIQDTVGSNERWGRLSRKRAREIMAAALEGKPDTEPFLQAGYDLGLFEDESAQAGEIRFVHQQMQEYFAAWVLAEDWDAAKLATPWKSADLPESTEALLDRGGDAELPELPSTGWEESALMAASLCERPEAFVRDLIPANLALAGRCAAQPGLKIPEALRGELRKLLIARTQDLQADLRARIAAGKVLGELGDPRLTEQPVQSRIKPLLPPFAAIPGGEYRIDGDPEGFADENSARKMTLERFELALHPVTNAEYARFLQAGGYLQDAYWPGRALAWRIGAIGQEATQKRVRENRKIILDALGSEASAEAIRNRFQLSLVNAKWWQEHISESDMAFEAWLAQSYPPAAGPFVKPAFWHSPSWGNPAQPVVGVCWYEAHAYCLWLNDVLESDRYRLPSEAEWEAAARGRSVWRRYAWGDDFDPLRANTAETRLGVTTPVGVFPEGATPDTGLLDLCGNVWEWTQDTWHDSYEGSPVDGAAWESDEAGAGRVIRGGSWDSSAGDCRSAYRSRYRPELRVKVLGFRCARVQGS